ncbi:hypothetical protein HX137_02935 [Pseudomonas sp. 165]|uniref:hypothetical protein n=1 Tax=Pseudomonas sp. 165 TaxID=2746722 RepID=UPI002578733E|nr:hypothetical protein [Pseudomonas sp. 165]MDM1709589.1 hypothetical protein [Pseudomonas sp. 165]
MQIRKLQTVYRLIRTTYDPVKKRGVEKLLCSFPITAQSMSDDVRAVLTNEEIKQLEDWFKAREIERKREHEARELCHKRYLLRSAALALSNFRDSLKIEELAGEFTPEHANELWAELDATRRALRKAGYAKPKP